MLKRGNESKAQDTATGTVTEANPLDDGRVKYGNLEVGEGPSASEQRNGVDIRQGDYFKGTFR